MDIKQKMKLFEKYNTRKRNENWRYRVGFQILLGTNIEPSDSDMFILQRREMFDFDMFFCSRVMFPATFFGLNIIYWWVFFFHFRNAH